jgi:two-component system OmpR family response regulator
MEDVQRTVIVVDDQAFVRQMLVEFLTISGYKTFGASDSVEALKLAAQERLDIALVDVHIPEIDGVALFGLLKQIQPDLTGLFMSGSSNIQHIKKAGEKDTVVGLLIKPFNILELLEILNYISSPTMDSGGKEKWKDFLVMDKLIS